MSVTGSGEPERVQALFVTDGTLSLLHVNPILGRHFTPDDDSPKTPERVLLSHAYWERKFGSDPAVVGKSVVVDGKPREIIGVLPAGFRFLDRNPQLVLPFRFNRAELHAANFSYRGVARLKPGMTIEQANADVARLIPVIPDRFPMPPGFTRKMFDDVKMGPNVRPLSVDVVGDIGRVLWVLLGTVGLVLLIACANVANLFLVRAEARQQELAIHAALGAGSLQNRVGTALGEPRARAGGRRRRPRPRLCGHPRPRRERAGGTASIGGNRHRSARAGSSRWASRFWPDCSSGCCRSSSSPRRTSHRRSRKGDALSSAGRERHRARNGLVVAEIALAVVLLVASGPHDPDVPGDATGRSRIRAAGGSADACASRFPNRSSPTTSRRSGRSSRLRASSSRFPACDRSACRTRSRWTATTATIRSSSRTSRRRRTRSRRCAVSSGRHRTTSRRWATRSSRAGK